MTQEDRQGNLQGRQQKATQFANEFEHALGDLEDSQTLETQDMATATTATTGRQLSVGKGKGGCSGKGKGGSGRLQRRQLKGTSGKGGDCEGSAEEEERGL